MPKSMNYIKLCRHLDSLSNGLLEALNQEVVEEIGALCEENGGVEGFVVLTEHKGSAQGRRSILRTRDKAICVFSELLNNQGSICLSDAPPARDKIENCAEMCFKKIMK